MPAHEKDHGDAEADVKRDKVEKVQQIPEASMLMETMSKPLPPSVAAEIPQQTAMSKEAAERVLSYWAEANDGGEEKQDVRLEKEGHLDPNREHEEGMAADFKADSLISAADYLAPDDARKTDKKGSDD